MLREAKHLINEVKEMKKSMEFMTKNDFLNEKKEMKRWMDCMNTRFEQCMKELTESNKEKEELEEKGTSWMVK